MKKKIKVLLAAVLAIAGLLSFSMAAEIAPRWSYITVVDGTLDISSGGSATVSAKGEAYTQGVDNVKLTASLQQQKNGSWTTIKSWSASANARQVLLSKQTYPVAHGYSYRLSITLKAYKDQTLLESGSTTREYGYFS